MGEDRARDQEQTDEQKTPSQPLGDIQKAKVAIEVLGDGKTIAEIVQKHDVHPNEVSAWRRQLIERAAGVFGAADLLSPSAVPA